MQDLARAAGVSQYWRSLTEDYLLWKEKCQESALNFDDYPSREPDVASSCYSRSSWKALYLRHSKVGRPRLTLSSDGDLEGWHRSMGTGGGSGAVWSVRS